MGDTKIIILFIHSTQWIFHEGGEIYKWYSKGDMHERNMTLKKLKKDM